MKKINILHFRNCRGISTLTGPETYLLDLINNSDHEQFNTYIACCIDPHNQQQLFIEELQRNNIQFTAIEITNKFNFKDFFQINKIIKKYDIDIIHTHDARSDVIGFAVSRFNHIPLISFAHGWVNWPSIFSKERLYAYLESQIVIWSDRVLISSKYMYDDLIAKGVQKNKISFIPIGIDTDKFHIIEGNHAVRKEFDIPLNSPLIGVVSRIHPWKGQKYFLQAAEVIAEKYPEARYLLVGDVAFDGHTSYKNDLKKIIEQAGLNGKVIFTGSRKDIPEILNSLDLFVLPSLHEPFGLVVLEAQACGIPVVVTKAGGIPETMEDGKTGILVSPGNKKELANTIISLLQEKEKMRLMGLAGRERVVKHFSVTRMVRETEALYRDVWKTHSKVKRK